VHPPKIHRQFTQEAVPAIECPSARRGIDRGTVARPFVRAHVFEGRTGTRDHVVRLLGQRSTAVRLEAGTPVEVSPR
jgi:hypothetical protein